MLKEFKKGFLSNLVYFIPKSNHNPTDIKQILTSHPEIQFVSLMGVDLRGNDTDEKIPVKTFLDDIDKFLEFGIQTDGSSVVLHNIATLNDAKVDILPDKSVNWFVDYNFENLDDKTGLPVGTLRIPSFLVHNNKMVCSRSILKKSIDNFKNKILNLLSENKYVLKTVGIDNFQDIEEVLLTSATELEFWVKTPENKADEEKLSTSQNLKEQYWKRTQGIVRTALEKTIWLIEKYGVNPEMGHKEVGGIRSTIGVTGKSKHVLEQLEIDWQYSNALQAADNELIIRNLVTDVFQSHGLEVSFLAKPIEGVAGNGEHTHLGVAVKLTSGKIINLFSPIDMKKEYLSPIGFGALMGILKNYEVVNPFVTSSNDALNRLKPGFEAPVCIVSSLGKSTEIPSRNRSILVGLIRDIENPLATRFELRAPNPLSNTYLVLAASYQTMLDGIKYSLKNQKTSKELEIEFSKKPGEKSGYLEINRQYRSEEDVFEFYTEEERNELFGLPPKTVWDNAKNLDLCKEKREVLIEGNVFSCEIVNSFKESIIDQWLTELKDRILGENMEIIRSCKKLHNHENVSDLDVVTWEQIYQLKCYLMKDKINQKSLFTKIRNAIDDKNYDLVSILQIEMNEKIKELKELYSVYKRNLF
ncbi:type I glutamate--ammonia ligase [Tepidibacter thalassicus]|uniref:glutamine synthetase n=1 Tax=Tepidibacter thalassicus DSM 15285 TaxID=1123350 RepID=A0A1M5P044_9FIRM|nr:glutamine synthetase [Tepidibacter thalassicus]SHG95075.1 L-glutamine synthetase [Tepidibacter thalassicus DSM 15285]